MDVTGILAAAAGAAALVRAARKKRRKDAPSSRRRSTISTRLGTGLSTGNLDGLSLSELLSGRLLVRDSYAAGARSSSGTGAMRAGSPLGASGPRGRAPVSSSRGRGPDAGAARGTLRRRPDRAELEREGVPHPLILRRRRDRRRELLREVANVSMGAAAIGVSTAGLLFDMGTALDWSLGGGALAGVVFGWILGRAVLYDLIHLGA